jgi:ABC-type polysaccharide/polyol phosphate export permease
MSATSEASAHLRSSAIRPGPIALVREGVSQVLARRRLVGYLVRADLKKKGADTILGNIWWVIDPLLQMAVYVVLVSVIFANGKADYPLFVFAAILPWKWFTSSVNDGISSVVGMEKLIKQINFPKLVLPVSAVVAGIVNFFFGLIPLLAMTILFYHDRLTPLFPLIFVVAIVQLLFSLVVAIFLGAINVFYRDVGNLARHVLRLWFYVSPGIYALDQIEKLADGRAWIGVLIKLNPWTTLFTAYRDIIYNGKAPDFISLGVLSLASLLLLALAILFFKRVEPTFAKVL